MKIKLVCTIATRATTKKMFKIPWYKPYQKIYEAYVNITIKKHKKEDLKTWKDVSFPWIRRLSYKLLIHPKINLKIQHHLNKTLNDIMYETDNAVPKFIERSI